MCVAKGKRLCNCSQTTRITVKPEKLPYVLRLRRERQFVYYSKRKSNLKYARYREDGGSKILQIRYFSSKNHLTPRAKILRY